VSSRSWYDIDHEGDMSFVHCFDDHSPPTNILSGRVVFKMKHLEGILSRRAKVGAYERRRYRTQCTTRTERGGGKGDCASKECAQDIDVSIHIIVRLGQSGVYCTTTSGRAQWLDGGCTSDDPTLVKHKTRFLEINAGIIDTRKERA
jgi:hypothetical protein